MSQLVYEFSVEKKSRDFVLEPQYWLYIKVYKRTENTQEYTNIRKSGYHYSMEKVKKVAIKFIQKTEKNHQKDDTVGTTLGFQGTADEVIEAISELKF